MSNKAHHRDWLCECKGRGLILGGLLENVVGDNMSLHPLHRETLPCPRIPGCEDQASQGPAFPFTQAPLQMQHFNFSN